MRFKLFLLAALVWVEHVNGRQSGERGLTASDSSESAPQKSRESSETSPQPAPTPAPGTKETFTTYASILAEISKPKTAAVLAAEMVERQIQVASAKAEVKQALKDPGAAFEAHLKKQKASAQSAKVEGRPLTVAEAVLEKGNVDQTARQAIFEANLRKIDEMNAKSGDDLAFGITSLTHLSQDEYKSMFPATDFPGEDSSRSLLQQTSKCNAEISWPFSSEIPPSIVSWAGAGYETPARNQGQCGSCAAFAAMACAEVSFLVKGKSSGFTPTNTDLSEQMLLECTPGDQCLGYSPAKYLNSLACTQGALHERQLPYVGKDTNSCPSTTLQPIGFSKWTHVPGNSIDFARAVARGTVAIILPRVSGSYEFANYKSGILPCTLGPPDVGSSHAIQMYAYQNNVATSAGKTIEVFVAKNSWGPNWGLSGSVMFQKDCNGVGTLGIFERGADMPVHDGVLATVPPSLSPPPPPSLPAGVTVVSGYATYTNVLWNALTPREVLLHECAAACLAASSCVYFTWLDGYQFADKGVNCKMVGGTAIPTNTGNQYGAKFGTVDARVRNPPPPPPAALPAGVVVVSGYFAFSGSIWSAFSPAYVGLNACAQLCVGAASCAYFSWLDGFQYTEEAANCYMVDAASSRIEYSNNFGGKLGTVTSRVPKYPPRPPPRLSPPPLPPPGMPPGVVVVSAYVAFSGSIWYAFSPGYVGLNGCAQLCFNAPSCVYFNWLDGYQYDESGTNCEMVDAKTSWTNSNNAYGAKFGTVTARVPKSPPKRPPPLLKPPPPRRPPPLLKSPPPQRPPPSRPPPPSAFPFAPVSVATWPFTSGVLNLASGVGSTLPAALVQGCNQDVKDHLTGTNAKNYKKQSWELTSIPTGKAALTVDTCTQPAGIFDSALTVLVCNTQVTSCQCFSDDDACAAGGGGKYKVNFQTGQRWFAIVYPFSHEEEPKTYKLRVY